MSTIRKKIAPILRELPGLEIAARHLQALVPLEQRLGRQFFEWYRRFEEAETWTPERIAEYKRVLLLHLLQDLRNHHSFYKQMLEGFDLTKVADNPASVLPTLTRNSFRSIPYQRDLALKLAPVSTSGTTGNALQFFHDAEDNQREWAAICHQWRRIGYNPLTSRRAEFRGLVSPEERVKKFPEYNMLRCSILAMKPNDVRHYAKICHDYRITFLHGYPSALDLLARTCLTESIQFVGVEGIMLASEIVYPHQIKVIKQAFPCARIIAHYGNAERVALGAWCESSYAYHMLPLYSLVEVDDNGFLIGTNLFNRVNPFIRYRMSDQVSLAGNGNICSACGRLSDPLVLSVDGRVEDYLYSPVRGWIPPAIITYPLKHLKTVREIQLVQREEDKVELRYCSEGEDANCQEEITDISAKLCSILSGVTLIPVRCESLNRGKTGKFRWIISELDYTFKP